MSRGIGDELSIGERIAPERLEKVTGLPVRSLPRLPSERSPHPRIDAYVVAPASANTVAKLALGISDNQALTLVNESMGAVPVVVFPRVNAAHVRHPAWQGHLEVHRRAGVRWRYSLVHGLALGDDAGVATTRRADMFTADGRPSDDDPREHGPALGDERTTLVEALRRQRLTLELKCAGLDAEAMARRSVEPSTMSLLGLVRHLAEVERGTFRVMMAGQDVSRLFCSDADPDGDFGGAVSDPRVVAQAWDAWRVEVDFATRFVAEAASLDVTGDDPLNQHGSGGGPMSLREVLVGMIEEYARHMGHVDLLRERIDGCIGQ